MLESEPEAVAGRLQSRCTVDEKDSIIDDIFLAKFGKEHLAKSLFSRQIKPYMEQAVRVGIDHGVQLMSIVVELNHRFIDRNVIRVSTVRGL